MQRYRTLADIRKKFPRKTLERRITVRDDSNMTFFVIPPAKLEAFILSHAPAARTFHEVAHAGLPQKLRFDLDMDVAKLAVKLRPVVIPAPFFSALPDLAAAVVARARRRASPAGVAEQLLNEIVAAVVLTWRELYCVAAAPLAAPDVAVAAAHRPGAKFSYHLVVNGGAVGNVHEAQTFSRWLGRRLSARAAAVKDDVMLPNKSLRLPLCVKARQASVPFEIVSGHRFRAMLVTDAAAEPRLPVLAPLDAPAAGLDTDPVSSAAVSHAIEAGQKFDAAFVYAGCKGGIVRFQRTRPSHCRLCARRHDNDNSLFATVDAEGAFLRCRRSVGAKKPCIFVPRPRPGGDDQKTLQLFQDYL